jgi:ATP adenylyltransferase
VTGARGCHLCGQAARDESRDLIATLSPPGSYDGFVAAESSQFVVIPSLGPLAAGHVILCPRSHARGFARLPLGARVEFALQKRRIKSILEREYGAPVHGFEHGASDDGQIPCSVEHAHFHLVPGAVDVRQRIFADYSWEQFDGLIQTLSNEVGGQEYLWYEPPSGESYVAVDPDGFPSQYLRRVFADALGRSDRWNWRETPEMPTLLQTLNRVRAASLLAF